MRVFHFARVAMMVTLTLAIPSGFALATQSEDAWVWQVQSANGLVDAGNLDSAEAILKLALQQAEGEGDDLRISVVLHNLARLLDRKGHALQAEKTYLRAIRALTRSAVTGERLLARTSVAFSALYLHTGQIAKAEALIRTLLAQHPAAADADKASLMGSYGIVLEHKLRFEEAEQVLRTTQQMCAGASETAMIEIGAIAVANIAGIQMRGGRTEEALVSYRQAIEAMEAAPNPSPTTSATTLGDYAGALRGIGNRIFAEAFDRKAIAVAEAGLGPYHLLLGRLLESYAGLLAEGRKEV